MVVYNPDEESLSIVSQDIGWNWAVNPITQQVAYLFQSYASDAQIGDSPMSSTIRIASFDGQKLIPIKDLPTGCNPLWSPDGQFLAYELIDILICPDHLGELVFFHPETDNYMVTTFPNYNSPLWLGWIRK
jgi:hypothetical protein